MTVAGLSDLVVEVLHWRDDDNHPYWSVGSGFFVGSRLVLTASHNVDGPGELLVRVHGTEERPAVVRLQGDEDIVDLAVLEVPDMVAMDVPPLRYGAVDRDAPTMVMVERCWAIGFPLFKERAHDPKPLRLSAQVNGEIPTGENLNQPLLTLQVRSSPRPLPSGSVRESEWEGISGAVVFSGDYIVVGVITEHHPSEGESALTVVPITALDPLPEAREWWKLLGVDRQMFVLLPIQDGLSRLEQRRDAVKGNLVEPLPNTLRGCVETAQWNVDQAYDLLDPEVDISPADKAKAVRSLETAKKDIEHLKELLQENPSHPKYGSIIDQVHIITDQVDRYLIPYITLPASKHENYQQRFTVLQNALTKLDTLNPQ